MTHRKYNRAEIQQRMVARHVEHSDADTFFNLLTSQELLNCVDGQAGEYRERLYTPTQTLAMFMAQVLQTDRSCQCAVDQYAVRRLSLGLAACGATTGSYCEARGRVPLELLRHLQRITGKVASERGAQKVLGYSIKLIDGATVSMADTHSNQQRFAQPCTQAPGVGFPLARLVAVLCLGSGAALDVAIGAYQGKESGEHALLRMLLDNFSSGDLVIADCYYASYFLIAALQARGVKVLFGQHAARTTDFRCGKKLGTQDHVVDWHNPTRPEWMSAKEYAAHPALLAIREVRVQGRVLITTLLDSKQLSPTKLEQLYRQRWHVELDLRAIKTTLGMEVLSCKSADMVVKEIHVYLLAYNLIRLLMTEAARHAGIGTRDLSFKHTVQCWLSWQGRDFIAFASCTEQRLAFYRLVASRRVGKRPGRSEPRAVKRRPKPRALLTEPRSIARRRIVRRYYRATA